MQQKYESEIHERESALAELNKAANIIGFFKVIWIVMFAFTFYQVWTNQFPPKLAALLCTEIIIFTAACIYHGSILNHADRETCLICITKRNIDRITGDWRSFDDIGKELIDINHNYSSDLDIVGRHSLFQFLNSTNTYYGRQRISGDLLNPEFSHEEIINRQKAISELAGDYAWTSHIEYLLSKIGVDPSFPKLILELQRPEVFIKNRFISKGFIKWMLNLSRTITTVSIFYTILSKSALGSALAGIMMIFQFFIWSIGFSKINRCLGIMQKLPYKMNRYYGIVKDITDHDFHTKKLQQIQSVMSAAQQAFHSLSRISGNISQCQNGIIRMILNALLLWDYKNVLDLERWKQEYGASAQTWFAAIAELESLISFSNLPRSLSTACIPIISTGPNYIQAESMGHPLLNNTIRVCNDLKLENQILIISGSNMSGKTTFMRTVGMNIILANAGSYVCAKQMECSSMKAITSMRIADELTEGISTFYAELKRIKKIIDAAKSGTDQLFLIDEIFRGTNSADRLKGAEEVIKKLCTLGVCGMITTHDLEVCKLADAYNRILNYSFNEHYEDGEICFDYKMKNGVSRTTNAEYLLRKVGII